MLSFPQQKWQIARTVARPRGRGPQESAHLIIDRLYLGDWGAAGDKKKLIELGITHVLSILEIAPDIPSVIEKDNQLHVRINDTANADILRHLEETTNFIKSALESDKDNKVLVHCLMGISRSATVVAAYLVATRKMAGSEAIAFLQAKRKVVCPNLGFRQQLDIYAAKYLKRQSLEIPFSPLRQMKAWTSAVKLIKGASNPKPVVPPS